MFGALFTSCDMDLQPKGTISTDGTVLTLSDITKLRTGLYAGFRGACTGSYLTIPDLMADQFNGTVSNGNRNGEIANALFTSATGKFASLYEACYSGIMTNNFFLMEAQKFIDGAGNTLSDEDLLRVKLYMGEAKFFRAYRYWYLFDHFCQPYSEDKAQTPALGLSLTTTYSPGGDLSAYPGRSTMEQTITLIKQDLADAYSAIVAYEEATKAELAPMSAYLNSNIVKAFEARVCLNLHDYAGAIAAAEPIVTSGKYPLVAATAYTKIWTGDTGSELLMVPAADESEGGAVSVYNEYNNLQEETGADYIPSEPVLLSYDNISDSRFNAFFKRKALNLAAVDYNAYIFYKWPGNSALGAGRLNKAKPFRTSELYLILAEAYAEAPENANQSKALGYLNDLLKARYKAGRFSELALQGSALVDRIREERSKELIGEGFRLTDLKRWGEGFTRDIDYPEYDKKLKNDTPLSTAMNVLGGRVVYTKNPFDHKYTWPIPSSEMDINPQLAGQQNPGY